MVLSYLKNIDTQLKRVFCVVVVVAFFPPNSRAFTETTRMYHVLSLRKCRDCYTRDIFLTCPQSFRGPAATSCSTTPLIPPTTQLNTQQAITCYVSKLTNDFKIQRCGGNENFYKTIGLIEQNNNFARASHFFAHFFAVFARLRRENA